MRLVGGTSRVLAAGPAGRGRRTRPGRPRRAQAPRPPGVAPARAGSGRLGRPAHRPALARRATCRGHVDAAGVRLEPATGTRTEPERRGAGEHPRHPSARVRPRHRARTGRCRAVRAERRICDRGPGARPARRRRRLPRRCPLPVAGPTVRGRRVRIVGAVRERAPEGPARRRARIPAHDRPRARSSHVGRGRGRAAGQGVPGTRAVPRAAHARPLPVGPAGRRAARVPGRPRRPRRRARHRARTRAARARRQDPRAGSGARMDGARGLGRTGRGRRRVAERDVCGSCARARPTPAPARRSADECGPTRVGVGRARHRQDPALRGARRPRSRRAHERGVGARLGRRRCAGVLAVGAGSAHAREGDAGGNPFHGNRGRRRRHRARRPRLRTVRRRRR